MRDMDIRTALHNELRNEHEGEPDTLILDELGLCQGDSRVDVAVVNGMIAGYEIKSERDTLQRLPAQAEAYNRTLDRVTIVANEHHLEAIEKMVPSWWGVQEAVLLDGTVSLVTLRGGHDNPDVDPSALIQLLWREEALDALVEIGLDKGMLSKPRRALWTSLVQNLALDEVKALVRRRLKSRTNWRSAL